MNFRKGESLKRRLLAAIFVVVLGVVTVAQPLQISWAEPQDGAQQIEARKPAAGGPQQPAAQRRSPAEGRQQPQPKPNVANQVKTFLQGIFGVRRDEQAQGGGGDRQQPEIPAMQLRRGAPHSSESERQIRKAASYMDEGNWQLAMEILQYQLDRAGDASMVLPDGTWTQIRTEADRLLGQFPQAALETYRLQNSGSAAQLLQDAHVENDIGKVAEVANRYFHTPAGHEAANELGTYHFDRGEFGMAARWFARLVRADADVAADPKWRLKAAFTFRHAGNLPESQELIRDLKSSNDWRLELGGEPVDPAHWLDETGLAKGARVPALDDWPLFLGTPSRVGTALGGEPVLVPRWSVPTTHSHAVVEQTEMLLEDLADQGVATVPVFSPLMVNGKAIFRTLRGVQVVEVASGRALWESAEDVSPEVLLNGQLAGGSPARNRRRNLGVIRTYSGSSADRHPLTSLLFRNGTYGIIGSDGERLFAIEDHGVLSRYQPGHRGGLGRTTNDPYRRHWATNRIVAYGLDSGRPEWQVGGPRLDEEFDPELAGTYFSGVPVRAGNELFVVGERDAEIRLFVLDPATGQEKWNTQIGESEVGIEKDFGRRWWTSQVAVNGGVAVCPTTVGWLVAVDRLNRSVMWARRYEEPEPDAGRARGESLVTLESLNRRWAPSAPIVMDGKVVYAPSEQATLYCFDLLTGETQWRKAKRDFLYVAGVFGGRVLLVGKNSVAALSLETGEEAWPPLQIPESDGVTSGMGVAVDHRYYLPLHSGQLWTLDIQDGSVLARSYLPENSRALGNLAMHRGLLLSLNPFGLTAYEQREVVEADIAKRLDDDPQDSLALLRQADIHLLERDYHDALGALRMIDAARLDNHTTKRYRDLMQRSLESIIRSDWKSHDRELQELSDLAATTGDKLLAQRLDAEQHLARGEYQAAFDALRGLAQEDADHFFVTDSDGLLRVRLDAWLAGKYSDLWKSMPEEVRLRLDRRLEEQAHGLTDASIDDQAEFVALFSFHPAAWGVRRQLADAYAAAGQIAKAENELLTLSREADAQTAASALEFLARLMRKAGLANDSDYYYRLLEREFPEVELDGGVKVEQLVGTLREEGRLADGELPSPPDWNADELTLSRIGTNHSLRYVQELEIDATPVPFFNDHRIEVDRQQQRLAVVRSEDDSLRWLLPLQGNTASGRDLVVAGQSTGHLLFVLHRDVLHCLSPVERRVLWTMPLDPRGRTPGYYKTANRARTKPLTAGTRMLARNSLLQRAHYNGMLAIANGDYVCVYGRRQITVLDSLTGQVRWTHEGVVRNTTIVGNERVVFIVPPERKEAVALRSRDGQPLDFPGIGQLLAKTLDVTDGGLLIMETQRSFLGLTAPQTLVRLYDPHRDTDRWRREWSHDTYLGLSDAGDLVALSPDGRLELIDTAAGNTTQFEGVPDRVKSASEIYAIQDLNLLYLIVNDQDEPRFRSNSQELPSVRVSGLMAAYDLRSGGRLWSRDVVSQNLVFQGVTRSPLLVFASKQYVQEPEKRLGYWRMNLLVLDRQTGEPVIETTGSGNYAFQSINVNAAERFLELRTNNQILRMQAGDNVRASAE